MCLFFLLGEVAFEGGLGNGLFVYLFNLRESAKSVEGILIFFWGWGTVQVGWILAWRGWLRHGVCALESF